MSQFLVKTRYLPNGKLTTDVSINHGPHHTCIISMIDAIMKICDDEFKYLDEFAKVYSKMINSTLIVELDIFDKIINGNVDSVINYFLENSTHIHNNIDEAICTTSKWCSIATIKALVNLGADITVNNCTPLINAIKMKRDSIFIKTLINMGSYIASDELDKQILTTLADNYNVDTLIIFMENGIDVNLADGVILRHVIDSCDEYSIKLLLDHGANIELIDIELLIRMVKFCSAEFVESMGRYGIDLTRLNNYDGTNIDTTNKIRYLSKIGVNPEKIAEIMDVDL